MNIEALARDIFATVRFNQFLGAELTNVSTDRLEITLGVREEFQQHHGSVHGGVLSFLADSALTIAGGLALKGDMITVEYKINFLKPARAAKLVAGARVIEAGKRLAVCQCEIFSIDGDTETRCAVAQGTIASFSGRDELSPQP